QNEIRIFSKNKYSKSENYSRILIPAYSNLLAPPNDSSVVIDAYRNDVSKFTIRWNYDKDYASNRTSLYIVWCSAIYDSCYMSISWRNAFPYDEDAELYLDTLPYIFQYKVGVALSTSYSTSGIIWFSCVVSMNKIAELASVETTVTD